MLCTPHARTHLPKPVHTVYATCMHAPIYPSPCMLCTPHACMHPSTQARAYCARHMHAPINPSPCILCTPHACTHLPKPVHTVHVTRMHPSTQARAYCARHMHEPIYPSPGMLCTQHACTLHRSSRMGCTPVARTHPAWLNSELPIRGAPGSRRGSGSPVRSSRSPRFLGASQWSNSVLPPQQLSMRPRKALTASRPPGLPRDQGPLGPPGRPRAPGILTGTPGVPGAWGPQAPSRHPVGPHGAPRATLSCSTGGRITSMDLMALQEALLGIL